MHELTWSIHLKSPTVAGVSDWYSALALKEPGCPKALWPKRPPQKAAPVDVVQTQVAHASGRRAQKVWPVAWQPQEPGPGRSCGLYPGCEIRESPDGETPCLHFHVSCSDWCQASTGIIAQLLKPQLRFASRGALGISLPFVLCLDLKFSFSKGKLFPLFPRSGKQLHDTQHPCLRRKSRFGVRVTAQGHLGSKWYSWVSVQILCILMDTHRLPSVVVLNESSKQRRFLGLGRGTLSISDFRNTVWRFVVFIKSGGQLLGSDEVLLQQLHILWPEMLS